MGHTHLSPRAVLATIAVAAVTTLVTQSVLLELRGLGADLATPFPSYKRFEVESLQAPSVPSFDDGVATFGVDTAQDGFSIPEAGTQYAPQEGSAPSSQEPQSQDMEKTVWIFDNSDQTATAASAGEGSFLDPLKNLFNQIFTLGLDPIENTTPVGTFTPDTVDSVDVTHPSAPTMPLDLQPTMPSDVPDFWNSSPQYGGPTSGGTGWNGATGGSSEDNTTGGIGASGGSGNMSPCSNGVDDDGDSFVDAVDVDCAAAPMNATESTAQHTDCNDGVDNDHDDFFDMSDMECLPLPHASEAGTPGGNGGNGGIGQCSNGMDDDQDTFTDGSDVDCQTGIAENNPQWNGECVDGSDNDYDDWTDGSDPGCNVPPRNTESAEGGSNPIGNPGASLNPAHGSAPETNAFLDWVKNFLNY